VVRSFPVMNRSGVIAGKAAVKRKKGRKLLTFKVVHTDVNHHD